MHVNAIRILLVLIAPVLPVLLAACSSTKTVRVAVPPRVDLRLHPVVGLVTFTSNANEDLERMTTQRFLQQVQSAQPGTRVVELGTEREVLASAGGTRTWDAKTLRAVGKQHGVDALVIGQLDVQKPKSQVHLSTVWKNLSARADVTASLDARLLETGTGATLWTNSSQLTTNVARGSLTGRGGGSFAARDPEAEYGTMVDGLVWHITDDFREHYVTRKVRKGETTHVASVRD